MGVFTLNDNIEVDHKIQTELDIICAEILRSICPTTILLAGSFGNGEGSVLFQNSTITLVADYDLLIIAEKNQLLTQKELNELKMRIMVRCQSGEIERHILRGCKIDIFQSTPEQFRSNARLSIYNMINNGSIVLYGKDIRPTVSIDLNRLAPSACYISLLKSISTFLKKFPKIDHGISAHSKEDWFSLIYYYCKIYLHMGTQLTLCSNLYHPLCRIRGERLKEQYNQLYPELAAANPDLPDKIIKYSELTLYPNGIMEESFDPFTLWFETRQDFEMVLKYCLKTLGHADSDSWVILSNQMYIFLKENYFYYYIEHYLKNRHHIRFAPITSMVNIIYQFRNAYKFYRNTQMGMKGLHLFSIYPLFKLYAISPLLLFSIQNDGTIDRTLFSAFKKEFSAVFPDSENLPIPNDVDNWIFAKDLYLKAEDIARKW